MHTNLVGASRENPTHDKRPARFFLDDPPRCFRRSPRVDYRHLLPMHGMTPDRFDYIAVVLSKSPVAHRKVKLLNFSACKLAAQTRMSPVVLCDHETAAGFPVQSVHNPGTDPASDTAQVFDMMQQGIDKGTFMNACTRMDHHAGGFIDNQEMFIFEKNLERNVFGLYLNRLGCGFAEYYRISVSHAIPRATSFSVDQDVARLD